VRRYTAIASHKRSVDIYADQLIAEGVVTEAEVAAWKAKLRGDLEAAYTAAKTPAPAAATRTVQ
jgi:2-oxoglutarate dehydrogenase complex dehydrogenase (E1) component-like enzyme